MNFRTIIYPVWWAFWLCLLVPFSAGAGEADSLGRHKLLHQVEVDAREAYLLPTHPFLKGQNLFNKPLRSAGAYHLKYAFRFDPRTQWGSRYPDVYQGVGVALHTFGDREEVGTPVSAYVFQGAPVVHLSSTLTLDYEWNFGISFGWKKYDPMDNPYNLMVGSKLNAYINLGWLLHWEVNEAWHLTAGVEVTHFSDGNTNYPNAGVNTLGGRVSIIRQFGTRPRVPAALRHRIREEMGRYFSYDLIVYGAVRRKGVILPDNQVLMPGVFGVAGFNFNPMYNVNAYFRTGVSLDAQYDESANLKDHAADYVAETDKIQFYRPPFKEQFGVGLSFRAELVMPIFSINLGVGHNIFYRGSDWKGLYQIAALKMSVTRRLFLHVGYQLHKFKNPNNLMLGFGYRFNGR